MAALRAAVASIADGGVLLIGALQMLRVPVRGLYLSVGFLAAVFEGRSALAVVFVSPSALAGVVRGCLTLRVAVVGISGGGALLIGALQMLRVPVRAIVLLPSAGIAPGRWPLAL